MLCSGLWRKKQLQKINFNYIIVWQFHRISKYELEFITEVIQQHYWMGASDFKEGDWRWVNDLSKVTYTDWNAGTSEPSNSGGIEDCAHFWHGQNYKWNDMPCKTAFAYICESPQVFYVHYKTTFFLCGE